MKKVGILTINDDDNYGNRLQNYATQEILKKRKLKVETVRNLRNMRGLKNIKREVKNKIKVLLPIKTTFKRFRNFYKFNKKIKYSSIIIDENHIPNNFHKKYDYFVTGSDQVWNPEFTRFSGVDLVEFAPKEKRNSLSASFGINALPESVKERAKKGLNGLNNISVREERGKEIIEELTGRKDVTVLVDPTMILCDSEWSKVAKKPTMLKSDKFVLNYFLGELATEKKSKIEKFAKENNCEVINILDKNSEFYTCGPSEFLYLEKNAFFIFTDSFHSCIFSILFHKPFLVFEREQRNVSSMNSRIDTLLKKFCLTERLYNGEISKKHMKINYDNADKILKQERKKFEEFLDKIFEGEK